jgi:hypothetical protein
VRGEQHNDENGVAGEPPRPRSVARRQHGGNGPQRDSEAKFEIQEAPRERQAIQEHHRGKRGEFDPPLHREFERHRPRDGQDLRQPQEQAGGVLDPDQPRPLRHHQVHREVGGERQLDPVIGIGGRGPVGGEEVHAREVVRVIDHRGDRHEQRRRERSDYQEPKNRPGKQVQVDAG